MIGHNRSWIIKIASHSVSTVRSNWVIICPYSDVIYKHKITKSSYTNTSLSSIGKYSFRGFLGMYFKWQAFCSVSKQMCWALMVLLSQINPLLFSYNRPINIDILPFDTVLLGPHSALVDREQFHHGSILTQGFWFGAYRWDKGCGLITLGLYGKLASYHHSWNPFSKSIALSQFFFFKFQCVRYTLPLLLWLWQP